MKKYLSIALALLATSCGGALRGGTIGGSPGLPAPLPSAVAFDVVPCSDQVVDNYCNGMVGAMFTITPLGLSDPPRVEIGNANTGYAFVQLIPSTWTLVSIAIEAPGYVPFTINTQTADLVAENAAGRHNFFGLKAAHVDPSKYTLGQRAAVRGAMWPRANVCADPPLLPFGPRPFQPDNIIATTYFDNYTPEQQEWVARCFTSVGFTHVVVGGLVDDWAYHGQYIGHDYSTDEGFEKFLDQHQWFYDHGFIPATFIHRDGATLAETQAMLRRLVAAHPRAQKLITIVIVSGWEPAKYEWSSCTWAGYVALGKELFPNALNSIHTVSDVDAPVGTDELCNDDDHNWNPGGNGAGWKRVIDAGLHAWFIQNGPYEAGPDDPNWTDKAREFAAQFKKDGDGALYHGVAWHFGGPGGWTGDSAFGPGIPVCLIAAENTAYHAYWQNVPNEPARAAWGNLAVNSGACGALDGISIPVPVRR